jgi:hypothetical protein
VFGDGKDGRTGSKEFIAVIVDTYAYADADIADANY